MAFILVLIMILHVHFNHMVRATHRQKLFTASLYLSAISIFLNGIGNILINKGAFTFYVPAMICATLYFIASVSMASTITLYLLELLLEHVYSKRCRHLARHLVIALNVAFIILMIANIFFGFVFSISETNGYERGVLGSAGYWILTIDIAMVTLCYLHNHARVSLQVKRVVRMLIPLVAALGLIQFFYPGVLLSGTIGSLALLVGLLNFQSRSMDTDSLTLVGDRKSMNEELLLRTTSNRPFLTISVSLRDFASINRRLGHRQADELLYQVATWLTNFNDKGKVFRYGKVTFVIVLPYCDEATTETTLRQLDEAFDRTWPLTDDSYLLSAHCCALARKSQTWDPERIITYLDTMKDYAKKERLRIVRFDETFKQSVDRTLYLAEVLTDAVEHHRFTVHYQPIITCTTKHFTHAEALLRLRDRQGNAISPSEFIPLAEKMGLIDQISWITLSDVCTFLENNPDLPLEAISVNLSMPQMLDPLLDERIESCLREHNLPTSKLKIEITERMVAEHEQGVARMLEKLANKGIGCYLDDFGTGYSNFSLVMKLPLECVKLDRSLLLDIASSKRDRSVVAHLISMLHAIGATVIAEGIETAMQATAVRAIGADSIQGFLFAKPMDSDSLITFMKKLD